MSFRRFLFKMKPFSPVIFGLFIGIILSLITAPFMEETCDTSMVYDHLGRGRKTNSLNENQQKGETVDYSNPDDFEPRIRTQPKPRVPKNVPHKFIRPRYASTELGIREKLYVAVLSSPESLLSVGVAQNKTLAHFVKKLVYFVDAKKPSVPAGMSVVSFPDTQEHHQPWSVFRYITSHYPNAYDWYLFVSDSTYVRGEKLMNFVNDISVSEELYAGARLDPSTTYCTLSGGLLISQSVLSRMMAEYDWCTQNALSSDPSANIGRCIQHATGLQCTDMEKAFKTYHKPHFDFDNMAGSNGEIEELSEALTVSTLADDINMYKTHKYFCELELKETRLQLEEAKDELVTMTKNAPGILSPSWPIGVQRSFQPRSRFDVLRWDYFTREHIYLDNEFSNVKPLEGAHKEDIDDVIDISVEKINLKYKGEYTNHRLVNGYRRMDATRGMEYTIDLAMTEQHSGKEVQRRLHLIRPLSLVEIVPMPYVTENTKLNLVVPVSSGEREAMTTFLEWYARTCLDSGDNTNLLIVFIYSQGENEKKDSDDIFSGLKSSITYYENKYQNGAQITWKSMYKSFPDQFDIIEAVSNQHQPNALLVLCSVNMELSIEYLNRVRMNTIIKWQVFFPISFQQYKPNLVYGENPYPSTIEVVKNVGYFNTKSFSHCGFYNADYTAARSVVKHSDDLFDLFVQYEQVHILRAIEPGLRIRYHDRMCSPLLSENVYQRCLTQRSEGLASGAQLAKLVFEQKLKDNNL